MIFNRSSQLRLICASGILMLGLTSSDCVAETKKLPVQSRDIKRAEIVKAPTNTFVCLNPENFKFFDSAEINASLLKTLPVYEKSVNQSLETFSCSVAEVYAASYALRFSDG